MTILGTVAGLGWGSLALYVSTSTSAAQSGYGGILAAFLIIFAAAIGWLRCVLDQILSSCARCWVRYLLYIPRKHFPKRRLDQDFRLWHTMGARPSHLSCGGSHCLS